MALGAALACSAVAMTPESCAGCHAKESKAHEASLMAQTLQVGGASPILRANPELTLRAGGYFYRIYRKGDRSFYSVTDGTRTLDLPILWGVGQGSRGQTFILEMGGRLYESWVSYYGALHGLALTVGVPPDRVVNSLEEAAGRPVSAKALEECFACHSAAPAHTANLPNGTKEWAEARLPGVRCESCHAGAARHEDALRRGDAGAAKIASLKGMGAEDMSELCGRCHRTWADIELDGPRGIGNVKFQAYRIVKSKCYDTADPRISCTACHDPHDRSGPVARAVTDAACRNCHNPGARLERPPRICKVSQDNCVSCHMPQYEMPGAHHKFTDHYIRIAKAGEPYPD